MTVGSWAQHAPAQGPGSEYEWTVAASRRNAKTEKNGRNIVLPKQSQVHSSNKSVETDFEVIAGEGETKAEPLVDPSLKAIGKPGEMSSKKSKWFEVPHINNLSTARKSA